MGGGSWKKTGSDAKWIEILKSKNIEITPLESANSGYDTDSKFHQLQGQYLKNIKVSFEGKSARFINKVANEPTVIEFE